MYLCTVIFKFLCMTVTLERVTLFTLSNYIYKTVDKYSFEKKRNNYFRAINNC